ncbi:major facilitator superfamily domain-containing protein [Staphylotrichum tortipilum]|uniref:Major facilitator superfamily domain-containing protein n=1 Tax=Staphylotrichum tortipilum TaxID=2831512 RepID=A0AAN6MBY4_9PEZI|nr:major facilitator superfamily domain-containing protein [Staphylotrichum longicolle]
MFGELYESNKSEDVQQDWVTGWRLRGLVAALGLVMFLALLDDSIVGTLTPAITSHFHSLDDAGWFGSAYMLPIAVLQPLMGKLFATRDKKWCFIGFLALFAAGSLLCGVATSSTMLIIGRAVAGSAVAGLQNGSLSIVASAAPLDQRAALNSVVIGTSQLGLVAGPLVGGALTSYTTWRWAFYINLPAAAAILPVLLWVRIPETKRPVTEKNPRIWAVVDDVDIGGFALLSGFAVQLLLALQWGGSSYSWGSPRIIGLLCGSFVTLAVFALWVRFRNDKAILPLPLLGQTVVWTSTITFGFLTASMFTIVYYLPIYLQAVKGFTAILSGVNTLPNIIAQIITLSILSYLVKRLGYLIPWSVASGILTSISSGLLTTLNVDTSPGNWIGYEILFGTGYAMGLQMPILAVQQSIAPELIPVSISLLIFSQMLLSSICVAVGDTILNNSLRSLLRRDVPSVDPETVIHAGAANIRGVIHDPVVLQQVLAAFAESVDRIFYISTVLAAATLLFVWGLGWKDIRQK